NEPQKTFHNKRDDFTTSWCRSAGGVMQLQQFLPLFTVLQAFTFQLNHQNLLVTAFEAPFHCRALYQKNSGQNYFAHWHQLCGDLGGCLEFPALQILCAENAGTDAAETANRYCAIREELQRGYAEQCGLVREAAVISSRLMLGTSNCSEALHRAVDELAHAGCKRVYVPGLMRGLGPEGEGERRGESPSRSRQGARQRVGRFVKHAHQRGMEVAVTLADCCAPWLLPEMGSDESGSVAGAAGGDAGDGLPLRALRDRTARQSLLDHLRRIKKELGVDALFADSLLDGITDEFDWVWPPPDKDAPGGPLVGGAPAFGEPDGGICSLQEPKLSLVAALQKIGYKCPLAGVAGLDHPYRTPDLKTLDGREFMFRDRVVDFPHRAIAEGSADPLASYFRGCANRLCYAPVYDSDEALGGQLADWGVREYAAVNKAFHAVREHMEVSRLLPQDRGVLWTGADPDVRVLWSYRRFAWQVGHEAEVFDVMASTPVEAQDGEFTPRAYKVYLVQNAEGP
ncbi:MAG: hypothetical protein ACYS8K_07695, partial [Planctomycetota bacterium]